MALDSSGNVYVGDDGNGRIQKFDSNGNFIVQIGTPGGASNQIQSVQSLAVSASGNIYMIDSSGFSLKKYNSAGVFQYSITPATLSNPSGVAVDASDNIYISDDGDDYIKKYDTTGTYLGAIGSAGTGNGQFDNISGVALDSSGNIYASDSDNYRIQKFDSSGVYQSQFAVEDYYPQLLSVSPSGYIFVPFANGLVRKYDQSGNEQSY